MSELAPEHSNDDAFIEAAMVEADRRDSVIDHTVARMIASQYHGGQASCLYSLASTGAIDMDGLRTEFISFYTDPDTADADLVKLDHLAMYLLKHRNRPPVGGWSELWGSP